MNRQYGAVCQTPLHTAARFGREDMAAILLAHGADLQAVDEYGDTPLHTAAQYAEPAVVSLLLAHGADVNVRGQSGMTPLHHVAFGLGGTVALEARLEVTRVLLGAGADVNARERNSGYTPLSYVAGPSLSHSPEMVALLLDHGAGVQPSTTPGPSALLEAAASGNDRVVRLLLDEGADVNAANQETTALGVAAHAGHRGVVTLLLERGADTDRPVPSSLLAWEGRPLAMALVVARSEYRDVMAARRDVAALLLAHGADVSMRNADGQTLVSRLAALGDVEGVELLSARGADLGAQDGAGLAPLHHAVREGRLEVVAALLATGVDPRQRTNDGRTPLDFAAGDPDMEALIRPYAIP